MVLIIFWSFLKLKGRRVINFVTDYVDKVGIDKFGIKDFFQRIEAFSFVKVDNVDNVETCVWATVTDYSRLIKGIEEIYLKVFQRIRENI